VAVADDSLMVEEFFQDMHANVTENISRLQRVNLADGWDVGTTPDDMSDDLGPPGRLLRRTV
jgi:hypothetical protein